MTAGAERQAHQPFFTRAQEKERSAERSEQQNCKSPPVADEPQEHFGGFSVGGVDCRIIVRLGVAEPINDDRRKKPEQGEHRERARTDRRFPGKVPPATERE